MSSFRTVGFALRLAHLLLRQRRTIGETLERWAARQPDAPACLFEGERISYGALNRRANRRAHLFRSHGVGAGEVVCLLMENRPEYVETLLGLAKLGAVTALIHPQLRGAALAHCLRLVQARHVVVGGECLAALLALRDQDQVLPPEIYVDSAQASPAASEPGMHDLDALLARQPEANPAAPGIAGADPALILFTSGTTGLPKAVRISHTRWYGAGLAMGTFALEAGPADVIYCPLPLCHSNGSLIALGAALVNGAALALARRFSAGRFWDEVRVCEATAFIYIGEVLRYLVRQPSQSGERGHRVRRILGNGLRPDVWPAVRERFGIETIREFYASTEGNAVLLNRDGHIGSVGRAVLPVLGNLALVRHDVESGHCVRNASGFCEPCAPGEVGELLGRIRRTTPFPGYTSEAETERKILRDVFRKGDAYFRSGDLLHRDADGRYYFVDRIGDTFRWRGENVSTQEVQEALSTFPGVRLVNVYGVTVPGAEGRAGMAALQLEDGAAFNPEAFFRHAAGCLAPFAVPAFLRRVNDMELTGTFKLRKTALQAQGFDARQVRDALYYLDRAAGTYAPLSLEAFQRIESGALSF